MKNCIINHVFICDKIIIKARVRRSPRGKPLLFYCPVRILFLILNIILHLIIFERKQNGGLFTCKGKI